jgi:ribosome-associated toxin RatA of RatAB toxin-antitoxin module
MRTIHRTARVAYSASQMFDLVADIEAYPEYVHWCRGAAIDRRHGNVVEATIDIGMRGIHKSFKTRNTNEAPNRIIIALISGPFRRLEGEWTFSDLPAGGCEVALSLRFEVSAFPLNSVFSLVFEELARTQMEAFISRAHTMYGRG